MDKQQLQDKLLELGIECKNCYPKSSFIHNGVAVVSCFESELREESYFFNRYDSTIYHVPHNPNFKNVYQKDESSGKYLLPMSEVVKFWKDEPIKEHNDSHLSNMTLREYACIHLGVPDSGKHWLDEIIRKSKK